MSPPADRPVSSSSGFARSSAMVFTPSASIVFTPLACAASLVAMRPIVNPIQPHPHPSAFFGNPATKGPFPPRRPAEPPPHDRARRFAGDRDVVGIAAEGADVPLNPLQGRDRVHHSVVAGRIVPRFFCEVR